MKKGKDIKVGDTIYVLKNDSESIEEFGKIEEIISPEDEEKCEDYDIKIFKNEYYKLKTIKNSSYCIEIFPNSIMGNFVSNDIWLPMKECVDFLNNWEDIYFVPENDEEINLLLTISNRCYDNGRIHKMKEIKEVLGIPKNF